MSEGLRERKKRLTRRAISDAAMRLFAEKGYEHTTIADIAAAADVSPRTFFAYFPTKEDVVFEDFEATFAGFQERLRGRAPGETAIDALRAWIAVIIDELDFTEATLAVRRELIRDVPAVAARDRFHNAASQQELALAVAQDLGEPPEALRPRMVAAAAMAALETLETVASVDAISADPLAIVDQALVFLRGGIAALQDEGAS